MSNRHDLLFLTCHPRIVKDLVEELTTMFETDDTYKARILMYGVMTKGSDGFLIIATPSTQSFPTQFYDAMRQDKDIFGYVLLSHKEE